TRNGVDEPRDEAHGPDAVVAAVGDVEHVTGERDARGAGEARAGRGAVVAGGPGDARAGDGGERAVRLDAADALRAPLAEVDPAAGTDGDAGRARQGRGRRGLAVRREAEIGRASCREREC